MSAEGSASVPGRGRRARPLLRENGMQAGQGTCLRYPPRDRSLPKKTQRGPSLPRGKSLPPPQAFWGNAECRWGAPRAVPEGQAWGESLPSLSRTGWVEAPGPLPPWGPR